MKQRIVNKGSWPVRRASCMIIQTVLTCGLVHAVRADDEVRVATVQPSITALDPAVDAAQTQRIAAMQRAAAATVAIFGLDGGGGGSGVLITPDGYALTNYHVSSACGDHMRCGLNDGRVYDAVIVGVDATGDVSLIKLLGREDFPIAALADSGSVRVGQWVFAAGNPFVLAGNLQPTVTLGIVSGVGRYQYPDGTLLEYADCIQTDAAINPGNSGGPLFNFASEVVGINGRCSFEKRGRVNVGVGYAISANQIKHFWGMLSSGRFVDHATLDATVSTEESGKVLISNILSSSDAYRRGLRYGDEIISFADRAVDTTNDFKNILGTLPKDWRVPISYRREGKTYSTLVRLKGVHTEKQLFDLVNAELGKNAPPKGPPQEKREGQLPKDQIPKDQLPKEEQPDAPKSADAKDSDTDQPPLPGAPDKRLVNSMLLKRPGFANYYFNQLNRDAVWKRAQSTGDFAKVEPRWVIKGSLAGEPTPVSIQIDSNVGLIQLGGRTIEVIFKNAMSDEITKRREGGLLVALRAWQQFLRTGPKQLGESIYLGTAPVFMTQNNALSEQPLHDVLQTAWYDTSARFSFPTDSGQLGCVEIFGDSTEDPVEVYFDNYREKDKLILPGRLRLQYGTEPTMLINIESITFSAEEVKPS